MSDYPLCAWTLKNGKPCQSVVTARDSEDAYLSRFCAPHAARAAELDEERDDEPDEDDDVGDGDVVDEGDLVDEDDVVVTAVATATAAGSPRDAIREFATQNPSLVSEFFAGVLVAERQIWMSCPACKRRSQVSVPNWNARTKAVTLLLEQGYGRPEPAPLSEDEALQQALEEMLDKMTSERLEAASELEPYQRQLLALPVIVQELFTFASADEIAELASRHGFVLSEETPARLPA